VRPQADYPDLLPLSPVLSALRPMKDNARLFNCARCQIQVIICSDCDRGNIYCSAHCSHISRQQSVRQAAQRYQQTWQGKLSHAHRQRCYRQRKEKKVTHHGSPDSPSHDSLDDRPNEPADPFGSSTACELCCHFCGRACSRFLRIGFLGRQSIYERPSTSGWPRGP